MSAKKSPYSGGNSTKELTVQNKLGIHARPAALFVKTANRFACDILVEKDGETVKIFFCFCLNLYKRSVFLNRKF